jgi:hypothetical protein
VRSQAGVHYRGAAASTRCGLGTAGEPPQPHTAARPSLAARTATRSSARSRRSSATARFRRTMRHEEYPAFSHGAPWREPRPA